MQAYPTELSSTPCRSIRLCPSSFRRCSARCGPQRLVSKQDRAGGKLASGKLHWVSHKQGASQENLEEENHESINRTCVACRGLLLGNAASAPPLSRCHFNAGRLHGRRRT